MKRFTVTHDLAYRIAFVRHCTERGDAEPAVTSAKIDLADAVLAAVPDGRLARLNGLQPRPAAVRRLRQTRRRA